MNLSISSFTYVLLVGLSLFSVAAPVKETRPAWVMHARDLIGETSSVRNEAVKKLSEIFPTFNDLAPQVKGEYRHYALDVAVAMKYPGSVEKLLADVESDLDGSLTLAVNALLDKDNHEAIGQRYIEFLQKHNLTETPTPVILAMVDFLTHVRHQVSDELFSALLAHSRLEVQQGAALYFAVTGSKDKQARVDTRYPQLYPQVRAQLMMTYFENKELARAENICRDDKDAIVQSACQGLQFTPPKPVKAKPKKKAKK